MVYERLHPDGLDRIELVVAHLCALVKALGTGEKCKISDFIFDPDAKEKGSKPEDKLAQFMAMTASHNAMKAQKRGSDSKPSG